jgi:hypothetical protein
MLIDRLSERIEHRPPIVDDAGLQAARMAIVYRLLLGKQSSM